jgi:hypothetical protein
MKKSDLRSMTLNELWSLHERLASELGRRMSAEMAQLERRLRQLAVKPGGAVTKKTNARRSYPQVFPMRASIVGPPRSATRISASIASCRSGESCSAFGSLVM